MKTIPIIAFFLWLAVLLAAVGGYIANIVKLIGLTGIDSAEAIIRIIGVIAAPIGAIAGYL